MTVPDRLAALLTLAGAAQAKPFKLDGEDLDAITRSSEPGEAA